MRDVGKGSVFLTLVSIQGVPKDRSAMVLSVSPTRVLTFSVKWGVSVEEVNVSLLVPTSAVLFTPHVWMVYV